MWECFLLGSLSMLAAVTAVDIRLLCGSQVTTTVARQEQDYAFEPNISMLFAQQCCTIIVTRDTEASLVLLKSLRPSEAACNATLITASSGSIFLNGWLTFTKPGLCKQLSERYTMAANNTRVCLVIGAGEPSPDGTVRPFAFSAVSALHMCDSRAWQPRASMALGVRPSYVFAPDQRLGFSLPIPIGIAECAPGEDYIRAVISDNVGSSSVMRVEILAVPDASSCRSLFVQDNSVREGDSFAITVGNQLTISYNMSRNSTCNAQSSSLIGFVVRISENAKANPDSSVENIFASSSSQGSRLMDNIGANSGSLLAEAGTSIANPGSSFANSDSSPANSDSSLTNSGSSLASILMSTGDQSSGNDLILVLYAFASSFL